MPDLPRQEPFFGDELKPIIAHQQVPAGTGEVIDAPEESIGECLRSERERTGKSLTDISHALKIMSHHLTAIENNSFEELPGRAYAIGFVRSYAAYLGLDAGALVSRLKAQLATPDVDPDFAASDPPECRDPAGTALVENGNADACSTQGHPPLERELLADSAQTKLQWLARALLRLKEIAPIPGERVAGFASPAGRRDQRDVAAVENGNARQPQASPLSAARRRSKPQAARAENGNARRPNFAFFSASPQTAQLFSTSPRTLPLPSQPEHPVRNWITAGIMGAAIIYFGSSMIHSGRVAAPPPVIPVPARIAAEAGFVPAKKIVPPALEQPARKPPEPASAPPAIDAAPAVAAVEKPAPISREAVVGLPPESIPALPDSAALEPKRTFHAQLPLGERYGEQNRGSRVTLRVHRATFVAVLGLRNHQYIDRVLRAGDTYRVPNMRGLKLNARDAGAVEVILDGNTVGFAGMDGAAVKGMPLQPQSIISRFHWLQE